MRDHNYFIYIVSNINKTTLYIGVTNDLKRSLFEHFENKGNSKNFAGKYHCHNLLYYERFEIITQAVNREKEIKKWSRKKKESLISSLNSDWKFLNDEI